MRISAILTAAALTVAAMVPGEALGQQKTRLTYIVKKGQSFYGICYKLGVSAEALLKANPGLDQNLQPGQIINVPTPEIKSAPGTQLDTVAEPVAEPAAKPQAPDPVQKVQAAVAAIAADPTAVPDPVPVEADAEPHTIAVVMPFMLNHGQGDKLATNALEFYRGLLLAADSMASSTQARARIVALDTQDNLEHVRKLCSNANIQNASVIIAPDDPDQRALLARTAAKAPGHGVVFNVFNVHDSLYKANPNVIQTYLPSDRMLEQAAEQLLAIYPGYTPVILNREGGRDDKQEFVTVLRAAAAKAGRSPLEINYRGTLTVEDLGALPAAGNYVLIPTSGSATEFAKFAGAVAKAREEMTGGSMYELFGYPDWTVFRGGNLELLHKLQATIYSRFFDDPNTADSQAVKAAYERAFNAKWTDAVPSPVLLGFDLGMYLLQNLQPGQPYAPSPVTWDGIQSSYRFEHPANGRGGYFNDHIDIIRFMPDDTSTVRL